MIPEQPLAGHNPDILTCLANLSADEVFTPPKLASAMLDLLPAELFQSPETTFLDPCCKSGVFLREIARRLNEGLRDQMPDEQRRVDHILTRQVFGLATSELTGAISRRSVYCSKKADGRYSIATQFNTPEGNIRLPRSEHRWNPNGKCEDCGARKADYGRGDDREAYAYPFTHGIDPLELFQLKFDVIIGNPPYQLSGAAGGTSDASIYHLFVQQAIHLDPRYALFVTPSRWLAGGRGLDDFRSQLLNSGRLRHLTDYPNSAEAFPGVQIKGGICFYLWDREYNGACNVVKVDQGELIFQPNRQLDEFDVFVRDQKAITILRKVLALDEASILPLISGDTPFGIATNFDGWKRQKFDNSAELHLIAKGKRMIGFTDVANIKKNEAFIESW